MKTFDKKFVCALEPFTYAVACVLSLHIVSFLCDCPAPIFVGGIFASLFLCKYRWPNSDDFEIAIRSCILGFIFAFGLTMFFSGTFWSFGLYLCALSFFHWSEFATLAYVNPSTATIDSFLLSHSAEYYIAAVCSWLEYFVETWLFPDMKVWPWISLVGVCVIIFGETVRKLAIVHLGENFTHLIQFVPLQNHRLITNGVYSYVRHPSYVGWFWFSIGTQLLLVSPFCVVAYAMAAWLFFKERIETEEMLLTSFFGSAYLQYKQRTITGLPFIKGYSPS